MESLNNGLIIGLISGLIKKLKRGIKVGAIRRMIGDLIRDSIGCPIDSLTGSVNVGLTEFIIGVINLLHF
ncbi:MAG: hypothetical protein ABIK84_02585 [candidate division WOR-3 bacterium]